tara:strand:- start:803 stop:1156 length:354 start_codon:yes stop_codon:yes gene_type:complete
MKKKIICFDLDNVICRTKKNYYKSSKPIKQNIETINKLYNKGFYIKIFTSRFMGRSNENANMAKKRGYKLTADQLNKWDVMYHKLIMGKPSYDLFIDDKNFEFKKNWSNKIKKTFKL